MYKLSMTLCSLILFFTVIGCKKSDDVSTTEENEKDEIQSKLDDGSTPEDLYNEDPSVYDDLYGKKFQGGFIIYFDSTNGSGIVAATEDQGTLTDWGCSTGALFSSSGLSLENEKSISIKQLVALGKNVWDGDDNTDAITQACSGASAARVCNDLVLNGQTDWFLPSKVELGMLLNRLTIQEGLTGSYWSSTQENKLTNPGVYVVSSIEVTQGNSAYEYIQPKTKNPGRKVRAIRYF